VTLLHHEALRLAVSHKTPIARRLFIAPLLDPDQIGPASIDLRLGSEFYLLRRAAGAGLDPVEDRQDQIEQMYERLELPLGERFWLHPGHFVLGATLEYLRLPADLGAYVIARSSWGRIGLLVATAIMVQPGYAGTLTLELVNEGDSPIALYPGLRVAQLAVHRLETPTQSPYGQGQAKYSSPIGPQASRLAWDRAEIEKVKKVNERLTLLTETP
jgi:dCTP deaminase